MTAKILSFAQAKEKRKQKEMEAAFAKDGVYVDVKLDRENNKIDVKIVFSPHINHIMLKGMLELDDE